MSKKIIYQGRIVQLALEHVHLPNGEECELEIVHHPGGAAVVALDENANVCLLRQYRHVVGGWIWELPAGKIDNAEDPKQTAKRELLEEAGLQAKQWHSLGRIMSSPGIFTEVIYLYLAQDLQQFEQQAEPHEVFEVHWLPLARALTMAQQGEIEDAKTLVGLLRVECLLDERH